VKCLTPAQLAIAASGPRDEAGHDDDHDDVAAELHLADCVACRAAVAEQRAIRELVRRAPAAPLPRARREAIAAEVMARSDAVAAPPSRFARAGVASSVLVAAAALAIVGLGPVRAPAPTVARAELIASEAVPLVVRGVAFEVAPDRPPAPPALVRPGRVADFTKVTIEDRDVLELRNGSLTVDARNAREIEITMRGTTVHVEQAKICVVARGGVISTVTVFAGSAEVSNHGKLTVVEAGMVWVPDAVGAPIAMREFEVGWNALRGGDHRAAVEAFDRARDPVVAEDAAYWAAVAVERAGDRPEAARRFGGFLDLFPGSPHADAARVALERLAR